MSTTTPAPSAATSTGWSTAARRRAAAAMVGGLAAALAITTVPGAVSGASAAPAGVGETPVRLTPDDLQVAGYPNDQPVRIGDALYYAAYRKGTGDRQVWRTTDDGVTEQVTDIGAAGGSSPGFLTAAGDLLLYAADDGTTGYELWQTDTTTGETTRLTDLDDIPPTDGGGHGSPDEVDGSTSPSQLTVVGDTVYFQGDDGRTGRELWRTDLDTGETTQAADLAPGGPYSDSSPSALTVVGDDLYFAAYPSSDERQIWRLDTVTGETEQITHVDGYVSAYHDQDAAEGHLLVADGAAFFTVSDRAHGYEPWTLDLATGQASMVADVNPGRHGSRPDEGTLVGHRLFFSASDGATGRELWQTDTRTGATLQRADIHPGRGGSFPQELTAAGSTLFFSARAQGSDQELWRTIGGGRGATQTADIRPGPRGSWPVYLVAVGHQVYFRPSLRSGPQLWRAGRGGAHFVAELSKKKGQGSDVEPLLDDDGRLVFRATGGLWTLD